MIQPAKFEAQRHTYKTILFGREISVAVIVLSVCLFFCSSLTCLFAVDMEISKFDAVSINVSTNITVTLTSSLGMEKEVCLNLRLIEGMGGAIFLPGGHTSTNISQTSTLQIIGDQLSSIESNMVLEVKVKEIVVASNIFTVVDMVIENKADETTVKATKDKIIKTKEVMITKSKAIEVARAAATTRGKMKIKEGASITVELNGRNYIVTFGSNLPKGWRGSSYIAKVTLDAFTSSVKQIIVAP